MIDIAGRVAILASTWTTVRWIGMSLPISWKINRTEKSGLFLLNGR